MLIKDNFSYKNDKKKEGESSNKDSSANSFYYEYDDIKNNKIIKLAQDDLSLEERVSRMKESKGSLKSLVTTHNDKVRNFKEKYQQSFTMLSAEQLENIGIDPDSANREEESESSHCTHESCEDSHDCSEKS